MIHLEYILMLMNFWIMISWTDFTRRYEKNYTRSFHFWICCPKWLKCATKVIEIILKYSSKCSDLDFFLIVFILFFFFYVFYVL